MGNFLEALNANTQEVINGLNVVKVGDSEKKVAVYDFVNPTKNKSQLKTFDADIITGIEKIKMALHGRKVLGLAICRELSKLNNKEKLESMGFKNIGSFASAMFDISQVTANQYARIGEIFVNDEYKINSDILPSDLAPAHLLEMLKYLPKDGSIENIEELYLDGILVDGMSTKKLRANLKEWKDGNIVEGTATESTESTESTDSTESSDSKESTDSTESTESQIDDVQLKVGKTLSACDTIVEMLNQIENERGEHEHENWVKAVEFIRELAKDFIR